MLFINCYNNLLVLYVIDYHNNLVAFYTTENFVCCLLTTIITWLYFRTLKMYLYVPLGSEM